MGLLTHLRYENAQDAQMRLNNSVVRHRGRPAYVGQNLQTPVQGAQDLMFDCQDMLTGEWTKVHSSDEDLDIRSQYMGYVNTKGEALYAVRMPCRRQQQGLTTNNTFVYSPTMPVVNNGSRRNDNPAPIDRNLLMSKDFALMLMNEYPSIDECLQRIGKPVEGKKQKQPKGLGAVYTPPGYNATPSTVTSIAFGRKLLLAVDEIGLLKLHYWTTPIGFYNRKDATFVLTEQFEHYLPLLKKHDVPVMVVED